MYCHLQSKLYLKLNYWFQIYMNSTPNYKDAPWRSSNKRSVNLRSDMIENATLDDVNYINWCFVHHGLLVQRLYLGGAVLGYVCLLLVICGPPKVSHLVVGRSSHSQHPDIHEVKRG